MKRTLPILVLFLMAPLLLFSQPEKKLRYYNKYHNCVLWGNKKKAEKLIEKGYSIDSKDEAGRTILMYCLKSNNTAFAEFFIDAGADVNEADTAGNTCLHYAIENTHDKSIAYKLIEKGAAIDVPNHQKYSPFHFSILFACPELTFYLIDKGVNYKRITAINENALHLSIETGCDTLTRFLLKQNINLFLQDNNGLTPLLQAFRFQKTDIAIELIKQGADIDLRDSYGNAALNFAIWNSDTLGFRALLAYDAKVDDPSFIRDAANLENEVFIKELLFKGATDSLPARTADDLFNLGLVYSVKADIADSMAEKKEWLGSSLSYFKMARQEYKKRENELLVKLSGVILTEIIEAAFTGYVSEEVSPTEKEYNYCREQIEKCNARIFKGNEALEGLTKNGPVTDPGI